MYNMYMQDRMTPDEMILVKINSPCFKRQPLRETTCFTRPLQNISKCPFCIIMNRSYMTTFALQKGWSLLPGTTVLFEFFMNFWNIEKKMLLTNVVSHLMLPGTTVLFYRCPRQLLSPFQSNTTFYLPPRQRPGTGDIAMPPSVCHVFAL